MGNLCSIYHAHFDKLVVLTNNHNKAVFLDKCIFWWQISTYTLGDQKIWFTRSIVDMAQELFVAERSINRYLDEMEQKGFIERCCKLSASNKNTFRVTKRLYIRVTEKLLNLLNLNASEKNTVVKPSKLNEECSFSKQNGVIDNANLAVSLYKVKDHNQTNNNTVKQDSIVNNFEKPQPLSSNPSTKTNYAVEAHIGERITEPLKNYVKGMLHNVQKQYDVKISDPNKLFAEVIFSVTQDVQWADVDNPHHRVNIIAKLLRHKQWKTPKGFYNHWDVGQMFRKKEQQQFEQQQHKKTEEGGDGEFPSSNLPSSVKNHSRFEQRFDDEYRYSKPHQYVKDIEREKTNNALKQICITIASEESYLKLLQSRLEAQKSGVSQDFIEKVAIKIAGLYDEKQKFLDGLEEESRAA